MYNNQNRKSFWNYKQRGWFHLYYFVENKPTKQITLLISECFWRYEEILYQWQKNISLSKEGKRYSVDRHETDVYLLFSQEQSERLLVMYPSTLIILSEENDGLFYKVTLILLNFRSQA